MDPQTTLTRAILSELVPKIREGLAGGMFLTRKDCENLMRVFEVSVTLETMIEHFGDLIKNTLVEIGEREINDSKRNDG